MTNKVPTKVNLLKTIYAGREKFERLINRMTEPQMTTAGIHGDWSVKDILAHLTAWERMTLERLNAGLSGRPLKIKPIKTDEDVEWMNEKVYAINQERPLEDVMDDFHTSFKRLMERVEEIGKKVLEKSTSMDWAGDRPVWLLIADNTYLHYEEHQAAIEKWLKKERVKDEWMIREETVNDLAGIRHVEELAFGRPDEADIVDNIRARDGVTLSLIALEEDKIIGHVLFSPVTITAGDTVVEGVGLGPVAVLPSHQKRGIGSLLCRNGLAQLAGMGHKIAVVLGHTQYYPRFGFKPAHTYGIRCKWNVPPDAFMVMELQLGALEGVTGLVEYGPEFG